MRTVQILWLFLISLHFINMSFNVIVATGHGHCLGTQESALLHLKDSLMFKPTKSRKLVHWNQSDDCCHWNGVTCSKGRVIALDLNEESIFGGLDSSSSLFNLQYLQNLNLACNDFNSTIPTELHKLEDLRYLNLSNAGFKGQIPGEISYLKKLAFLDLSNCQFNGTLPCSISELTQLVHVDLSLNNFTGPLPSFNKSKSLTYLSLYQNALTGPILSTQFEGLENLTTIDLAGNYLIGRFPSFFFTIPSLQILMLSANKFEGLLDEIPNASSSKLELLDISGNILQGPIPVSFFHLSRLSLFQLASNKFNGTIALDMMRRMKNLVILSIGLNNLSVDVTLSDCHNLSAFPRLKSLRLASCNLTEFPSFVRNLSTLRYLDLSINHIQGPIPNWIWRFEFMIYLNLSVNFLTDLEGPFDNISSNLFHLDLHSNQLQGSAHVFPKNLIFLDYSKNRFSSISPPDIGNYLSFSYFLSLSDNNFQGQIHESLCNASSLRVLDLSNNNFSGTIPACLIKTMSSTVRALNLGGNNLNGQIPDTFKTSCTLRFLHLNENFLSGTIPKSLGNCQKLEVLYIGNNEFVDRFPCFLRNVSTLRVMILRSNKFHGPLECPISIGDWKNLQIIDLAFNRFNGALPVSLLQSWKALMLDENEVRSEFGHVFFDIGDYTSHVDFNISYSVMNKNLALKLYKLIEYCPPFVFNHLYFDDIVERYGFRSYEDSVTIVNKGIWLELGKILIAFTSLDFSSNHFEGSIPEKLMSLKALHALNLSKNALSGHIPSSIGNLKYLESLDLSLNSLSGNIPTELASLSFLSFLNLSFNHLMGPIPIGTQIQSFEANTFKGNEGLCGPPLTQNCTKKGEVPSFETPTSTFGSSNIDWNFLSAELGYTFGLGIVVLPLIFWKRWRVQYFRHVDYILWKIFPQLEYVYVRHGGRNYRTLRWKPF